MDVCQILVVYSDFWKTWLRIKEVLETEFTHDFSLNWEHGNIFLANRNMISVEIPAWLHFEGRVVILIL